MYSTLINAREAANRSKDAINYNILKPMFDIGILVKSASAEGKISCNYTGYLDNRSKDRVIDKLREAGYSVRTVNNWKYPGEFGHTSWLEISW